MSPKFSFIIATRDRSTLLKETLESLLSQTEEDWEAVIVDNGSDNTREVVDSLNEPRFRYYKLSENHGTGASAARNFGTILAKSAIVGIMDDDDLASPERVEITLEAFAQEPDADLFYADIEIWQQVDLGREIIIPFNKFSIEKLKEKNIISHPTVAMKRQVLLDNPYNSYFKLAEDYELYTRLVKQGKKFIYCDKKIVKYRVHPDNVSIGSRDLSRIREQYGEIPKMLRGWIPFDFKLIESIEDLKK